MDACEEDQRKEWMGEEDAATYYHIGMKLIQRGDNSDTGRRGERVTDLRSIVVVNLHWMVRNWRHIIVDLRQTCSPLSALLYGLSWGAFVGERKSSHFPLEFFFYMLLNLIITTLEWIMSESLYRYWMSDGRGFCEWSSNLQIREYTLCLGGIKELVTYFRVRRIWINMKWRKIKLFRNAKKISL